MLIENNNNKIIVHLSEKDMDNYDISVLDLDFRTEKALALIEEWLIIAGSKYDLYDRNNRITIKSFLKEDEIIVEITFLEFSRKNSYRLISIDQIKIKNDFKIFEFISENDLKDLLVNIRKFAPKLNFFTYCCKKKYYLLLTVLYIPKNFKKLFSEYCTYKGNNKLLLAKIIEHGDMIHTTI